MSNRAVLITGRNLHRHHGSFPKLLMGVRKYEQVSLQSTIKVPAGREITYDLSWHLFEQLYDRKPYTDNYRKKEVGSWKRSPGSIEAYYPVFEGEVEVSIGTKENGSTAIFFGSGREAKPSWEELKHENEFRLGAEALADYLAKSPALTPGYGKTLSPKEDILIEDRLQHDILPTKVEKQMMSFTCYANNGMPPEITLETGTRRLKFSDELFKFYYEYKPIDQTYIKRKKEEMKDLFSVIDGEHKGKFVTKLAQNSAGLQVVEVRGTGEIFAVPSEALEKVMPFTVNVRYMGGANTKEYSFFAKADDVEIGDIIFSPSYTSAMQVVGVNTKSGSATTWLDGSVVKADKVLTKPKED